MTVKVLVIPAEGNAKLRTIEPKLDRLREALGGGWLEGVTYHGGHAYCDEEGKFKGLPVNVAATELAHDLGWPEGDYLTGTVIFLGNGPDGTEADVSEDVIRKAAQRLTIEGRT